MEAIMLNPKVVTAGNGFEDNVKQDLALVFIKAFDDKGNQFPINFDDVWRFLEYATKASALRKLKSPQFMEGEDYIFKRGGQFNVAVELALGHRSSTPDTYLLTTNAFEHFAMSAPGAMGHRVRRFYIACRDSYLENEAARRQQAPKVGDQAWNQARQDGIFLFHAKSGSVKNYLDARPDVGRSFYGEVNNLINQAILGFQEQTHEFKEARNIPRWMSVPDILDEYGQFARGLFEVGYVRFFDRPKAELAALEPEAVLRELTSMKDAMRSYLVGLITCGMGNVEDRLLEVPDAKKRRKEYAALRTARALTPSESALRILEETRKSSDRSVIVLDRVT
jgi:hypothetical protein